MQVQPAELIVFHQVRLTISMPKPTWFHYNLMDDTSQTVEAVVKIALTVACVEPVCWAEVPFCEEL